MSKLNGITFSGGMNNVVLPHLLRDGECEQICNLYLHKDGSLHDINGAEVLLDISATMLVGAYKVEQWFPTNLPLDCVDDFVYMVFYSNGTVKMVYRGEADLVQYTITLKARVTGTDTYLVAGMTITPADINGDGNGNTIASPAGGLQRVYNGGTDVDIRAALESGAYDFHRWVNASGAYLSNNRTYEHEVTSNITLIAEYVTAPYIKIQDSDGNIITSLDEFISLEGAPSDVQTYEVGGVKLTEDLVLFAPTDFEISDESEVWTDKITIPYATANAGMTKISVRYNPGV